MRVIEIGRLHFLVESRTQPEPWLVDLEPEYEQPGLPYFCACPRFTKNTHYHHRPCHHIISAAAYVRKHYSQTRSGHPSREGAQKIGCSSDGAAASGSAQSGSGRRYTVDPRRRGASAKPGR